MTDESSPSASALAALRCCNVRLNVRSNISDSEVRFPGESLLPFLHLLKMKYFKQTFDSSLLKDNLDSLSGCVGPWEYERSFIMESLPASSRSPRSPRSFDPDVIRKLFHCKTNLQPPPQRGVHTNSERTAGGQRQDVAAWSISRGSQFRILKALDKSGSFHCTRCWLYLISNSEPWL
jgi:hypothetical protein